MESIQWNTLDLLDEVTMECSYVRLLDNVEEYEVWQ